MSELRLQHVEKLHLVVYIAMKKSVFLKFLLFGKNYKSMILITFEHLKKSMLEQNLEGLAQKMRLPRPSEAQN